MDTSQQPYPAPGESRGTPPVFPSSTSVEMVRPSRFKRALRIVGWIFFTLFCLTLFTLIKLPQDRVKTYIDGSITAALAPQGIGFSATKSHLSLGLGVTYWMEGVTLTPPPPATPAKIDRIEFSPALFSMIFGNRGGKLRIYNGDGKLIGSFSTKNNEISLSFKADQLDLGKLGVLPALAQIQGSAVMNGTASISGKTDSPATWDGDLKLDFEKINIAAQVIQGFSIPELIVSQAKLEANITEGKTQIKTFSLGKPGSNDDIIGTINGGAQLGKQWMSTTLDLKTRFSLSQKILKAFILIDALLGAGKQPDGSYAYNVTGPVYSPTPTPVKTP